MYVMRSQLDNGAGVIILSCDGGRNWSYVSRSCPVHEKANQSKSFFSGLDGCFYDRILFGIDDFQRKYLFLLI